MTWALVVVGGGALLGAGASYAGSKKQSDAAKKAAGISQDQYGITRGDQVPYMQSGYGAMSKLNTLLGINPGPRKSMQMPMPQENPGYAITPGGGINQIAQMGPQAPPQHQWNVPEANMGNLPLQRILMIRAQHGDTQAQAMLRRLS